MISLWQTHSLPCLQIKEHHWEFLLAQGESSILTRCYSRASSCQISPVCAGGVVKVSNVPKAA